ncbi:MAG: RDD family protein [Deltaproteobacteria bacterium]|nr:RDD family protein [Deltaproteobacteria bacterium]
MFNGKTGTLRIRTPEGVAFSLLLAGPVTRFLAWAIDLACVSVAATFLGMVLVLLKLINFDFGAALQIIAYFLISTGYGIVAEWYWRGQTLGKRLLRLRVMDAQGLRLQFSQVVVRNLLRFVDLFPAFYLVGGLACLVNRRNQRLGDLAANTIVIRHPVILEPDVEQLMAGKYNSFREFPLLVARLRESVSPEEAGVALQAIMRRDELDDPSRVVLFNDLASHFQAVARFPEGATVGLADEQYVRNVVDLLFRRETTPRLSASSLQVGN